MYYYTVGTSVHIRCMSRAYLNNDLIVKKFGSYLVMGLIVHHEFTLSYQSSRYRCIKYRIFVSSMTSTTGLQSYIRGRETDLPSSMSWVHTSMSWQCEPNLIFYVYETQIKMYILIHGIRERRQEQVLVSVCDSTK